jgi:hypothetical protein
MVYEIFVAERKSRPPGHSRNPSAFTECAIKENESRFLAAMLTPSELAQGRFYREGK